MRRRHFGARGRVEFARQLAIPLAEYERYERSEVPPGETMLRMCELTGEDLQWLLVGRSSRGTVVIDAPQRHRGLIARIARELETNPRSAAPLEAFVDLLTAEGRAKRIPEPRVSQDAGGFLPLLCGDQIPLAIEASSTARQSALPPPMSDAEPRTGFIAEPASEYPTTARRAVRVIESVAPGGATHRYLHSPEVAECFPCAFGVMIEGDSMRPMFEPGDAAVVSVDAPPIVGRPAVCRTTGSPPVRCGIWLGQTDRLIQLGRVSDSGLETLASEQHCWSLEALYRVALHV